jgi:hypothetical protein
MVVPPVVVGTSQVVGSLLASIKNAIELAKASSDHELKVAVLEVYDSVLQTKARLLELDEQLCEMKRLQETKARVTGPSGEYGYFFIEGKTEPLCPKCWQAQPSNVVHLGPHLQYAGAKRRECPVCDYKSVESHSELGPAISVGQSMMSRSRGFA